MRIAYLAVLVCTAYGLLGLGFGFSESYFSGLESDDTRSESRKTYKYDSIDEVKRDCKSVLSSASELKPDDNRVYSIKKEMGFVNGDWKEVNGKSPILPFDARDVENEFPGNRTPSNLVSFWVRDIDRDHRSKKSISVIGVMMMGTTLDGTFEYFGNDGDLLFRILPGHSALAISFQGIYTESKKNGGERVMCLLGSTMLPARETDSADPWQWVKDINRNNYNQPPLLQDDRILLILRYPMKFTLTSRAIQGEMRSLNPRSNPKYFDPVTILSQLESSNYEFASENLVAKACDPYPSNDTMFSGGISVYKGSAFCRILDVITPRQPFTILPNWRCSGTDDFCSKLGPFTADKEINSTDGSFKGVKLFMQGIKCEQATLGGNASSARVSALFRVVSPWENLYPAAKRSGINNMTVAAEGIWKSTSGQLCMVGCTGFVEASRINCNSRICLYIPLSFSMRQRSIIFGTFFSINKPSPSYFPLSFEALVQPTELWNLFRDSLPYYSYTKITSAGGILEKNEAFSFHTMIKKSFLQFPKLEDTVALQVSLSSLAEDLTLQVYAVPDSVPKSHPQRTYIQMEIVSIGPLFGRYWSAQNSSKIEEETPYHTKAEYTEKQLLLNVSTQLMIIGKKYSNFSVLFLEGLYDQHVGKMYLVGCRDVRASWKILSESMDLESGLDCLIEVVVSYPPTTARWLVNPTASISIVSQRNEDDPLYFKTVKLQTFPIMYRKQREAILSRRGIEGILHIVTLSLAIACISSQLFYIKHNMDFVPYISLGMLGVQAIGYSIPLVTGAEALFKKVPSESYDIENNQWFHIIDYTVKLLVMASFLLTLRLFQKVWKARERLQTRTPLEPHRVPSDKKVILITFVLHSVGYMIILIIHSINPSRKAIRVRSHQISMSNSHLLSQWETELEEYMGLVQDFFLLPQVIGNIIWQIDCKPLRNIYFTGITLVRLFPHFYDYFRAPTLNPYFAEDYELVNPSLNFYSKFWDIAIPVTAVLLAVIVYIQQRWNYESLSQTLTFGQYRLLPFGSRMYERLPSSSRTFEAELVSGVSGNDTKERELYVE